MQSSIGFVIVRFVSLTEIASTDVLFEIFFHVFPSKVFASIGIALFRAKVNECFIVNLSNNLFA